MRLIIIIEKLNENEIKSTEDFAAWAHFVNKLLQIGDKIGQK